MDKRSLSLGRDIRGKKRAKLSTDTEVSVVKDYKSPTFHEVFNKFMEIKRSEGMSKRREEMFWQHKKYFVEFLRKVGYSELMKDITTEVLRAWMIDMQEQYVVYQTHVRVENERDLLLKPLTRD